MASLHRLIVLLQLSCHLRTLRLLRRQPHLGSTVSGVQSGSICCRKMQLHLDYKRKVMLVLYIKYSLCLAFPGESDL